MPQNESINNTEDYINYTFHISSKGVGTVAGELVGLSNTVSNLLGDIAFKTSEMLSNTETLAIGTSIAVGAMFTSAIKDSIRFEQQMANVKAIGGESLNAQEIGNAAMEYSNKFGMATASMTEGLEALARAGITTTSVMKSVLEEGVKLSKLEGMDLEDSINDLIATTNLLSPENVNMNDAQYADMVKQMNQHIVSTSESAPINAQNIIQSLQHVGGYASAGGMDQDDLFAVIAQLGSRGTKGEMAGTALRAFIAAGQKDTAQRALARIGLNVSDLWNDNGETMLSISEMKDVLDNALEARGYSKQEKLEFYSDFAGYKQANQIMKIDTSEVQQYKEQIANAWDLGKKLDTILGTVRGNLDRIWQITQNFMTKVGGKILFIANAILTPVRMLLELINKMPFADTSVAAGMIIIGFNGVLKIINNIVPRFSTFFIQLSQSKRDALDIRNVWRKLPDDIAKAKDVLKAMSDPQKMIQIQQDRQLYSKKEIEAVENKVARVQFIHANLGDSSLNGLTIDERKKYLSNVWSDKDNIYKENFINSIKAQDPEKFTNMMQKYLKRAVDDSNLSASRVSYDIEGIATNEALWDIDNYVGWIYRILSDPTFRESKPQEASIPSGERQETQDNRQRNARVNERKTAFRDMGNNILRQGSEYGDYSYKVNPNINMPQFNYNDIEDMRRFEAQVKSEIQRKMDMYANFFEDSSIEAGRNRLKKSLTIAAKTDLGYEFSTGANTSDIKKILETGNIREGSSHILDEQLQTIADILETELTGNRHDDMRRFSNILNSKNNKDELLASILNKTQEQWNSKYYNNGRVGYFPTNALKEASGGVTAQKIMEKVGVSSIAEVQEHFKNVALDDTLLNECVDIMYQDKELVEKLVNEEIKYMYENLARVQNSILSASRESRNDSTFHNKGEEYVTNLQKARDYVLADFNPNEFERFTSSPNGSIGKFTISQAIDAQNQHLLQDTGYEENIEGFQGYIYPIGGDIARSQRYGNDNFKIRNIKHIPYNKLLGQNVEEVFLDRHGDIGFDFMETFADWVSEVAAFDEGYWETTFDADYADDYWISGFEGGQEKFNELKQELEEIYRAYVDLCAWGAQSLIEATTLYGPMVSYRGGRLYTPENSFGAFDTITSTSLHYGVAKNFWNENPQQRKILEIFSPEDTHGVLAHTDLLNDENEHLWGRERELTFGKDQPYLHLPNPEGFEERLLMLTDDQKNAVKEIMGEGFEFEKNAPFDPFLNAGEPDYGGSFDLFDKKYPNLHKNHKPLNMSKYIDKSVMEQIKQESQLKKKYRLENAGESSSNSNILRNKLSLMLNKDNLTADNMGIKLQDLLTNGAISVGTKYRSGSLGGSNSDDVIDINTGTIKYHADNYNELYGDYGNALLDTVLHEMTHILMMHKERQNYENNNIPSELGIDNFKTSQLIQGYDRNFVAEYEAQYVSSQVLNRLGIEANQKSQQRMAAFKDLIESKGYGDQIQYELLDNLVDEMLSNITVIGDITEELSTQFDMASAGVTSMQVSEDMRPILSKIQSFNKNIKVYEGPDAKSKKDEIDQILSDMGGEINLLSSYGFDDSMIYNMVAQKFLPYIQQHSEYGFDTFYEYASSNRNIDKTRKYDNVTDAILNSWEYFKYGEGSSQIDGRLSTSTFYDYISKTYGKDVAADAQKWIEDASKNVDGLITYANTENPGISLNKNKIPNMVKEWNNTRKQLAYFESISLPNAGISMLLPVHKEFAEHGGYTLDKDGNISHDVAQKYIHKNSAYDARKFLGIVDLLDTDFFRNLDKADQDILKQAIAHGENAQYTIPQLMDSDGKLGEGWGAINITTAMDCMGRLEDGSCQFCDACYAFGQAARLPEQAIKQIAKSLLFANTSAEDFAKIINQQSIQIVRFNQEGDFKDLDDYLKTAKIAELSPNSKFYGYTKNEEILEYIKNNGTPDNYQMNNSLGTWDTGNYVVAHWSEIIDYLEKDYKLCQGACEACKQCLVDINKVTILRAGGEPLKVGNLKHLTTEGQIEVFKRLRDKEAQGDKVTKQFAKDTIKEVSRISKFVKPIKGQTTLFSNQGEYRRLPELADYYPIDKSRRNTKFIESLGYGGMDRNIMDFFNEVDETFIWEENELNRKKKRTDDHWGTREVINFGYHDIGTQTARLLNYGLYYNRKPTGEAKQTGIEEIVNLFNKDATKEAFMQGIISHNQLKKWHKQLQGSAAVDEYGEVPWGPKDIEEWKKEKDEADQKLADLLKERKKKIAEALEAQNEVVAQILPILSLMSVGVSNPKTKQATLDPLMTQTKAAEFGMPGLVENSDYIKYQNEMRKQQERQKAEQIRQQYSHISGAGVNVPQDHSMPNFSSQAYADFQNKYAEQGDYLLMNKWDKARYKLNQDGKSHKWMNKGIDTAEWLTNTIQTQSSNAYQRSQAYAQEHGSENLEFLEDKMDSVIGATAQFRDTLSGLSEIFPILTPAVEGLNIALQAEEAISTGLGFAIDILNFARTGETESTFLQTMANWANSESALQAAAGQMVLTGVTWLASAAEAVLAIIRGLGTGTLLILAGALLAVVAAVELLKFWENKHAEALKESQKALEEATAKNNIALSQYKDLKKARENETNAMKKQQLARKEAIALYELEAARIKKRKAVQDEAKLRNDAVWGEYGLRASLQKMGLGFIAGGDFQSQYENYDGTTANIRQIKEGTLGNLFASSEQRYVASVYDRNSNFFAEIEAYKEPLQELYDKESKLIEQYGSIDLARGTKEFEEAVQEFADATGINGETAVKMLEWLETENKVNQATKVGQAQIGVIRARADAKVAGLEYGEGGDLNDMDTLGNAMVMAQFQEMMNTAKTEVWWELLYAYLDTFISILLPWKWGDISKNLATVGIRQEELAELDAEGNNILNSMYDAYENAERRDYGSGVSYVSDTPFGGAVSSAATMYAEEEQQKYFAQTGHAMSEEDYMAIQEQYQEDTFGVTHEGLKQKKAKEDKEAYEKAKAEKNKKATTTLAQLQNNGEQAHRDALDIIDAIKNPRSASGVISGAGAGIFSLLESNSPLMSSLRKRGLKDVFKWMSGEEGTLTGKVVSTAKGHFKGAQAAYADDGFSGLYRYGKEGISKGLSGLKTEATVARDVFRTNGWSGLKGYAEGALYNSKLYTKFSNRVAGAREINAWSEGLGTDIGRTKFDKMVGLYDGAKAAYADDSYKGLARFGKEVGKNGIKGLAQAGKSASSELGGVRGIASSVSSEVGGIRGLASSTASGMKDIFNPKALAGGVDDIAKGLGGSGTLAQGIGKVGGRALAFLGPALAFAGKASELNPFEGKHYNEDGTEKKALQATGEVVGTTAGALGGVAGGLAGAEAGAALGATIGSVIPGVGTVIGGALGAVAGGIAGGWLGDTIFQPIGDAIGGTIGWLGDNLLGGIQNVAGTVWDGLTGAAGGVWDAVSGAATGVWDFLTGGENSDQPVGGLLGLTPIGMGINAASGIFDWLSGGNGENDPYKNIETATGQKMPHSNSQNTVIIKNININTEDDPEKIKSALMNLIIEMQEQISPRQVSRTVGEPPASQSTSDTQDENSTPQAEGTDAQSGTPNGNDSNTNPTT